MPWNCILFGLAFLAPSQVSVCPKVEVLYLFAKPEGMTLPERSGTLTVNLEVKPNELIPSIFCKEKTLGSCERFNPGMQSSPPNIDYHLMTIFNKGSPNLNLNLKQVYPWWRRVLFQVITSYLELSTDYYIHSLKQTLPLKMSHP